jgi:uncharacterized membrane protein
MNRQFERYLQVTLILLDLLVLNTIYFLCQIIFSKQIFSNFSNNYFNYWIISNILWIVPSFILRTYADKIILSFEHLQKELSRFTFYG